MPTYVYQCKECGVQFERFQHFSEAPLTVCPECHGEVYRVIHPVGVIFKGSGWYVKDSSKAQSSTLPRRSSESKDNEDGKEKPVSEIAEKKPAKNTKSEDTD